MYASTSGPSYLRSQGGGTIVPSDFGRNKAKLKTLKVASKAGRQNPSFGLKLQSATPKFSDHPTALCLCRSAYAHAFLRIATH